VTASDLAGRPDLYTVGLDGKTPGRLTEDDSIEADPSPCGDAVVFSTNRSGPRNIWRIGSGGGAARQLTRGPGPDEMPQCSPDGEWLYYTSWGSGKAAIQRAPVAGGSEVIIKDRARGGVLSPDGTAIVCQLFDDDAQQLGHVAIVDAKTGAVLRRFRGLPREGRLGWYPNGNALVFVKRENGAANLWKQPLDGASATQLTRFPTELIAAFAWSPDGKILATLRGLLQSELVRIGRRQENVP